MNFVKQYKSKLNRPSTTQKRGDTLIEVIFAFAILGTIIGFAFTGVIQARKSAVAGQERTQALEMVQYQSEALQTYRRSLPWDNGGSVGICPTFINGSGSCATTPSGLASINKSLKYCMVQVTNITNRWKLSSTAADCNALTPFLSNGSNPVTTITFRPIGQLTTSGASATAATILTTDTIQADIKVEWKGKFNVTESVSNIVILTKQL